MNLESYIKSGQMMLYDILGWAMSRIKEGNDENIAPIRSIDLFLSSIPII